MAIRAPDGAKNIQVQTGSKNGLTKRYSKVSHGHCHLSRSPPWVNRSTAKKSRATFVLKIFRDQPVHGGECKLFHF